MPLVDVPALAARLGDPRLRICDVRWSLAEPGWGREAYETGHLPGALFVDVETDLTGAGGPGRHPLPSPAAFAAALGRLGIAPGDTVVAYDAASGASAAARLWWMLRSVGHADAAVLDGGIPAWTTAGLPLATDPPPVAPVTYPESPWTGVVDAAGAAVAPVLVDARAAERYRGDVEPIDPRAGHIPGAVNVPYEGNVDAAGAFLPRAVLAERYAAVGDDPIVYCGSGVTACHDLLALAVLGIGGRLYEGSWSDWCTDPGRPAALGPS